VAGGTYRCESLLAGTVGKSIALVGLSNLVFLVQGLFRRSVIDRDPRVDQQMPRFSCAQADKVRACVDGDAAGSDTELNLTGAGCVRDDDERGPTRKLESVGWWWQKSNLVLS